MEGTLQKFVGGNQERISIKSIPNKKNKGTEVEKSLQKIKNNKSARSRDIPIELVEYGPSNLQYILAEMFCKLMVYMEYMLQGINSSMMSSIYKKGNKLESNNYIEISATSFVGYLYGQILKTKRRNC